MGRRNGGGALTAVALVLSILLVAVGAAALYLVANTQPGDPSDQPAVEEALEPKSFSEYSWSELSRVAKIIADSPVDESAGVAAEWGIEVGDTRPLPLTDGRQASLTVIGICHDDRSDGQGRAGLTLMTSAISLQPMNASDTVDGGWEGSDLRDWLASDGLSLLPDDLAAEVVSVHKNTNNVGKTDDDSSVTQTDETLWLFSLREICGEVTLFVDEYGEQIRGRTDYIDYGTYDELLNLEGEQYAYFSEAGVTCASAASGVLEQTYGGSPTAWWYRSPYPYAFIGESGSFFYQAMESGYPSTLGYASSTAGVVVGLCL